MKRWLFLPLLVLVPALAQVVTSFQPRYGPVNDRGNILLIGNTLMCAGTRGTCNDNQMNNPSANNAQDMIFADYDPSAPTWPSGRGGSSSATLTLPSGAQVLWAGLYWGARANPWDSERSLIGLKPPGATSYQTISGTLLGTIASQGLATTRPYVAFADVTSIVQARGSGTYWVGGILAATGPTDGLGFYAGWSLVVVYRHPSESPKNLVVYDGLAVVSRGNSVTITPSGFLTPAVGAVNAQIGAVAFEGDGSFTGDQLILNGTPLSDDQNPSNNFFNSSISRLGSRFTQKTPNFINQMAVDIDLVDATGRISNGATSATLKFTSTQDNYFPAVLTYAVDVYLPDLKTTFTKTVTDLNGGQVLVGDILEYTVSFQNTGLDGAIRVLLTDPIPPGTQYVPGSLQVVQNAAGAPTGTFTDALGDDIAEYDATNNRVVFRLGTGATATQGGLILPGQGATVRFKVRVLPNAAGQNVVNTASITYNSQTLGAQYTDTASAEVTAAVVGYTLSGRIFEDTVGAAQTTNFTPSPGVAVRLYRDSNNNGQIDASDSFLAQTSTDANGVYTFSNLQVGRYLVVVDSRSLSPSAGFNSGFGQGDVWAEQTYGPDPGALLSGTPTLGPRYGGAAPGASDGFNSADSSPAANASAKHRAWVEVSGDLSGVDFAFSFQVVTNLRGGDAADDDPSANRTVQGSLRQFIQNANAIQGPNTMRFVPAAPYAPNTQGIGGSWWTLAIIGTNSLPALTDPGTTLDGTAYDALNPLSIRDTNPGTLGTGGSVGVDGLTLPQTPRPELALDFSSHTNASGATGLRIQGGNIQVRHLALYGQRGSNTGGQAALFVTSSVLSGQPALLEGLVVGALPDGRDPSTLGAQQNRRYGIRLEGPATLRGSYLAYNGYALLLNGPGAGGSLIEGNEFAFNGPNNSDTTTGAEGAGDGDAVAFRNSDAAWTAQTVFRGNLVRDIPEVGGASPDKGKALELWGSGVRNVLVENNTLLRARTAGIGIHAGAQGNTLRKNILRDTLGFGGQGGAGVHLSTTEGVPLRNRITQNHFGNNRSNAIDLDGGTWTMGDGITPNDGNCNDSSRPNLGLDFPVITQARAVGGNLVIEGTVCAPVVRVEIYQALAGSGDTQGGVGYGEGIRYLGEAVASGGTFSLTLPLGGMGLSPGDQITALAFDGNGNTSEFSGNVAVVFGYTLSGQVYHDREPDGLKGPSEDWTGGPTVWVKLVQGSNVLQTAQVSPGSGAFQFQGVAPGSYTLVLDNNNTPSDPTPTPPAGWLFVNPAGGSLTVSVSGNTAGLDFGLFHGSVAEGRVFRDDGLGGGTANDALQNGGEVGIAGVEVRATDGTNIRTALTDGNGYYRLYLPAAWGNISLSHPLRPATGWNNGSTATRVSTWAEATGASSPGAQASLGIASGLAGQVLVRNFGVVRDGRFYPDAFGQTTSPGLLTFAHWYSPGTLGNTTLNLGSPSPRYTYLVRLDSNCNGVWDAGEGFSPFPYTFTVGASWPREADGSLKACRVEVQALVPAGEPQGATDVALVRSELAWSGNPGVVDADGVTDTLQVAGGEVRLTKEVRNATQGTPYGTSAQGKPGDVLEYCIAYRNLGVQGVSAFVLTDPVPFFTDALTSVADYGGKAILWQHGSTTLYLSAAQDGDPGEVAGGVVRVQVGAVGPGEGGKVCYRAKVR